MKKLIITALSAAVVLSMSGCAAAQIEKAPVVVENQQEADADITGEDIPDITTSASDASEADPVQAAIPTPASKDRSSDQLITPSVTAALSDTSDTSSAANSAGSYSGEPYTGTIELEGTTENVNYKVYHSALGYRMAYDVDRFSVTTDDGIDSFMAENPDPELYPYLYINIQRFDLAKVITESKNVHNELDKNSEHIILDPAMQYWFTTHDDNNDISGYVMISGSEFSQNIMMDTRKLGDATAHYYTVRTGSEWNSAIKNYYFITTDQYVYQITTQYFVEAEEGFGARISAMLDTFTFE